MTEKMSQHEKLFEEAFDLIIRLPGDPGNPAARELAERWRARGKEHEAGWAEADHVHGMTGRVVQARSQAVPQAVGISRRRFVLGGSVAVAAAATGLALAPGVLLQMKASHLTSTGEIQQIPLEDGSEIILGPNSAIASRFTADERRIELLNGMAWLNVADDARRPFNAVVEGMQVVTQKGAFDLSRDADLLTVAVEQGAVDVATPGLSLSLNESVTAGSWLSLDRDGGLVERGTRNPQQFASWRSGMLVAESETVAAVVARISRWVPGKVLIASRELGEQRISGVYNLANPQRALAAVIQPYAGKVREITPWLTIISAV